MNNIFKFYNNIDLLHNISGGYSFAVEVEIEGEEIELISSDYFKSELLTQYPEWKLAVPSYLFTEDSDNLTVARTHFKNCFNNYWEYKAIDLERIVRAWSIEYNPLENYDRKEDGSYTDELHKGTKTSTNVDTTDTETPTVKTRTTNFVNGDDNATAMESGHNDTEIVSGNTQMHSTANANNNYTKTEDIDSTHFDYNKRVFDNYRIHGNIGVTTNSQMALGELEMRMKPVVDIFIKEFVDKYELLID